MCATLCPSHLPLIDHPLSDELVDRGFNESGGDPFFNLDTATMPSGYDAVGTIKQIDVTTGKVTIAHEAIAESNWPAMTMIFTIKNKALPDKLPLDKRVEFQMARIAILANHIRVGIPCGMPQQRCDEQHTAEQRY
jgi:Cu/Ag efflux protein CusF